MLLPPPTTQGRLRAKGAYLIVTFIPPLSLNVLSSLLFVFDDDEDEEDEEDEEEETTSTEHMTFVWPYSTRHEPRGVGSGLQEMCRGRRTGTGEETAEEEEEEDKDKEGETGGKTGRHRGTKTFVRGMRAAASVERGGAEGTTGKEGWGKYYFSVRAHLDAATRRVQPRRRPPSWHWPTATLSASAVLEKRLTSTAGCSALF